MSSDSKKQQPNPSAEILNQIKDSKTVSGITMDDRTLMKMSLAQAILEQSIAHFGLVNMLRKKREITKSIMVDVRGAFQMVDEIFDEA